MLTQALVLAHVNIGQYSLPVPLVPILVASVLVVALSFLLIYVSPPTARDDADAATPVSPAVVSGLTLVGGVYIAFILLVAMFGRQTVAALNAGALLFWVLTVPLVPVLHCLVGGVLETANPFAWAALKLSGGRTLPTAPQVLDRLGYWPAVLFMFLLVIGESVPETVNSPMVFATFGMAYVAFQLVMGMLLGRHWYRQGEVFTTMTVLASTIAPCRLERDEAGSVRLIGGFNPGREVAVGRGLEALITLWLAGVLADGVRTTPIWKRALYPHTHPFFESIPRIGDGSAGSINFDVGNAMELTMEVLVTWAAFAVFFWFFVYVAALLSDRERRPTPDDLRHVAAMVAPSLIPIALAYLFAHNLTQLLVVAPLIWLARDAQASQLTGLVNSILPHIQPGPVWWTQVTAIVLGHVLAVVMAHARLARGFAGAAARRTDEAVINVHSLAFRADVGWLSAMLIYTATSLWILAQPITAAG